jgi:hypothetical protein
MFHLLRWTRIANMVAIETLAAADVSKGFQALLPGGIKTLIILRLFI